MTTAQLIVSRYVELLEQGNIDSAIGYLADDVIYSTWLGVIVGRLNVINFLRDNVRYMHCTRHMQPWYQVQHSLSPALHTGDAHAAAAYDEDGYDAEEFATFEHTGRIYPLLSYSSLGMAIKETIVLRNDYVVLVTMTKQL